MKREEVVINKKRATRSDKKRDIKPTISTDLKNCVYRLSYVTNTPVKDVVETFCEKGLQSRIVIEYLSCYFRRDYQYLNTLYLGDPGRESLQRKYQSNQNVRISTRVNRDTYEEIRNLSDALDVTPSKTTALLLDASIRNTNLINAYVKTYLHQHISNNRMKELKEVLKYINNNNPYNEEISWFALLSMIYEELKDTAVTLKEGLHNWIERFK
ncbi:hypothetical protein B4102_2152 [Heyndrickxia sporothermodurans]|uniref:Uncharacterized protein n=1 Tax=Heyndrickxia sporothermodurans TaxID=46224 RepID=A0A150LGQ5_9BACI|nr:hypothetical protein [Heyndrickxia sporothermodurans]KYD11424.1 hypothetical protein B4102_2152 [Heyndrickxia sporothermodurans]